MATGELSRLKKEMLRGAVRENVDLLKGRPPAVLRTSRRAFRKSLRVLLYGFLGVALFVSLNAISLGGRGTTEVIVAKDVPGGTGLSSEPVELAKPRPVDMAVFRLGVRTIVLDPGHGGQDPGARSASGLTEKDVTLDIALRLRKHLEEAAFKVVLTRESDTSVSLKERARLANQHRGDLFVSIHVNALPDVPERLAVETYYLGMTDDPVVRRLAGDENRESGYSISDYRRILEGVFTGIRQKESHAFAGVIQGSLFAGMKDRVPRLEDRGIKTAPFVVLVATEMPGVLAEVSSLSNEEEAKKLRDAEHRESIARALFAGVSAFADARNHPIEKGS